MTSIVRNSIVKADITLNVPAQFATIAEALAWLKTRTIAPNATATIQVADGTYVLAAGIDANHIDGQRIRIIGNQTTPANCIIKGTNPPTFDALVVSDGHALGFLDGFTFDLTAKALAANNFTAVLALNGASITCGTKVRTNNWYYGIAARDGATIRCDGAGVSNPGDVGIWAFCGSYISAQNATVSGASDVANSLGFGIQAEYGSTVNCSGASVTGCLVGGIAALSNSNVRALNAVSSTNTGSGFFARDGASIECHGFTANNNTRYGVEVIASGRVFYASVASCTGNTINNFCPRVSLDVSQSVGGRLVADDGAMRLDNSGTAQIYFNTSQGLQAEVFSNPATGGSETHYGLTQGTARARIVTISTLANADAEVESKGTGVVRLISNTKQAFQAYAAASTVVNYGQCDASLTGVPVQFSAQGTDANIDLQLIGKGTGLVRYGTFASNVDAPITGYITIKDQAGNARKLATIA